MIDITNVATLSLWQKLMTVKRLRVKRLIQYKAYITKTSSFIDSLKGVDYLFHLASPMPGKGSGFQADYVRPAVEATEAILHAALKFPQIQKVIVMSSVLALLPHRAASWINIPLRGPQMIKFGIL